MLLEQVRIKASVARLRSSLDMAKNSNNQLITVGESGGEDGIDRESRDFVEKFDDEDDDGEDEEH